MLLMIPEEPAPGQLNGLVKDHADPFNLPEWIRITLLRPVKSASGTTCKNVIFSFYEMVIGS